MRATETDMKSLSAMTFLLAAAAVVAAAAVPADATTCSSVCNQIRRACNHSAKGTMKAAYITCDETADACKADCEAQAATCPGACETAYTDCLGGGTGGESCDAARTQCLDECANCAANCKAARGTCRSRAKADRDALRAGCTDSRSLCREVCVDPLDKTCIHRCTNDEHDCRGGAKGVEGTCKKGCPAGGGKKSCIRGCRRNCNLESQLCGDLAVVCYAGCAGVEPTTTPTLP